MRSQVRFFDLHGICGRISITASQKHRKQHRRVDVREIGGDEELQRSVHGIEVVSFVAELSPGFAALGPELVDPEAHWLMLMLTPLAELDVDCPTLAAMRRSRRQIASRFSLKATNSEDSSGRAGEDERFIFNFEFSNSFAMREICKTGCKLN